MLTFIGVSVASRHFVYKVIQGTRQNITLFTELQYLNRKTPTSYIGIIFMSQRTEIENIDSKNTKECLDNAVLIFFGSKKRKT